MNLLKYRMRGSLIGGAVGDALGYSIERDGYAEICRRYGCERLSCYTLYLDEALERVARVSDNTQMALFTANAMLNARAKGGDPLQEIRQAYIEWYYTQTLTPPEYQWTCRISEDERLHVQRSPANACMSSLDAISKGLRPHNNSKGCDAVARIAPIAIYAAAGGRLIIDRSDSIAGEAARMTHHHPMAYMPALVMAHIVRELLAYDHPKRIHLKVSIVHAIESLHRMYPDNRSEWERINYLIKLAISLAINEKEDIDNIKAIGRGRSGDEVLAIGIYCALRYFDDFRWALATAVSHGGDSSSIGAVTGYIMGAAVSYRGIPRDFIDVLEMHDLIVHMADDLFKGKITKMPSSTPSRRTSSSHKQTARDEG